MNKIITIVVIAVLVALGFFLFRESGVAPVNDNLQSNPDDSAETGERTSDTDTTNIKEFTIEATNFFFTPSTIEVNNGDQVRITLKNNAGMHDLKLDEFDGASTRVLKAGESQTITFVADKSGTFEFYCSVGTHRQMGMVGKLIVN